MAAAMLKSVVLLTPAAAAGVAAKHSGDATERQSTATVDVNRFHSTPSHAVHGLPEW